ncbi:MAG: CotH kinase family protein [Clostridia bacterium]|nr:CotH kinase family protein [Clostridia bacterium]
MRTKAIYILLTVLLAAACLCIMALPSARPQKATADAPSPSPTTAPQAAPTAPDAFTVRSDGSIEGDFVSHLPLLCIENGGAEIAYGEPGWCDIRVIDNANGQNRPDEEGVFTTPSTIWVRGQSSSLFDKKSYGMEFFKKTGGKNQRDIEVLGMAAGHDWVLHGPYLDKALVRNRLSYSIARQTMFWAPDTRYCEVFLNGAYQGVYLIVEAPRVDENRIALADYALLTGETPYLLQRNRPDTDTTILKCFGTFAGKTYYPLYVRYPVDDRLTARQLDWITRDVSAFERALYADWYLDEARGYKNYIDMDSFVTYFVLMEFSMNKDNGFLSTYCCKDIGGKLMMGPVWDYNNGYDNYNGFPTYPDERGDGFVIADNNWYARMSTDRAFVDAAVEKYRTLRQSVLSTDAIMRYLDETDAYLGPAVARNFARWPQSLNWHYLGKDDDGNHRDLNSYAEAQQAIRTFIRLRGAYLDKNITLLYNNCVN